MKIVFLGTPAFAVPSLEILIKNGYEIAAVVTAPGKKAGRGLKIKEPAVKEAADKAGIKTLQPEKLNDPEFLSELKSVNADLFIVVAFRMLPTSVWQMPPLGTFNLHSSLLPQYRGAAPINRAIMNGETKTGVTTFFLKHEIDTGNILLQEEVSIGNDETAGELHDRLMHTGAELVLKTVRAIEKGDIRPKSQEAFLSATAELQTAPKIFSDDCKIDWNKPAAQVHNQIRGLSPYPGAFTVLTDEQQNRMILKIYRSARTDKAVELPPGSILISNKQLYLSCSDYLLEITELQQEGKKRNPASEFIKGFRPDKGWHWSGLN